MNKEAIIIIRYMVISLFLVGLTACTLGNQNVQMMNADNKCIAYGGIPYHDIHNNSFCLNKPNND